MGVRVTRNNDLRQAATGRTRTTGDQQPIGHTALSSKRIKTSVVLDPITFAELSAWMAQTETIIRRPVGKQAVLAALLAELLEDTGRDGLSDRVRVRLHRST